MKKYELTTESITHYGRTLYRIKALKDFGNVKKGDLGGFVESEANLSQEGNCWVYGDAKVFENAKVYGNADVYDDVWVYGDAMVSGKAEVFGNAKVSGDARVYENAKVSGDARVYENAKVSGDAQVFGRAKLSKNMKASTKVLTCNATKRHITVSDNHVKIGCEVHTFEHWLQHIDEIAKANDYSRVDRLTYKCIVFGLIAQRAPHLFEETRS